MKRKITVLLLLIVVSGLVSAEEQMTIAIMNVGAEDVPAIITNAVSEIIRSEFSNYGNFIVVERSKMADVIKEQKLILSGLLSEESAAEIGKLVSAQKIVVGELSPVGKEYVLILRLIDVETGQSEFSAKGTSDLDSIDKTAENVSRELAQKIVTGYKEYFTALTPSDYYLRSIVPGLGQFYADKDVEGAIFLGLNIAAVGSVAAAGIYYLKASGDYHNLPGGTDQVIIDEKYEAYMLAANLINYSLITLGGTYLLHWLDVLLFARPDFSGKEDSSMSLLPSVNDSGNLGLVFTYSY